MCVSDYSCRSSLQKVVPVSPMVSWSIAFVPDEILRDAFASSISPKDFLHGRCQVSEVQFTRSVRNVAIDYLVHRSCNLHGR